MSMEHGDYSSISVRPDEDAEKSSQHEDNLGLSSQHDDDSAIPSQHDNGAPNSAKDDDLPAAEQGNDPALSDQDDDLPELADQDDTELADQDEDLPAVPRQTASGDPSGELGENSPAPVQGDGARLAPLPDEDAPVLALSNGGPESDQSDQADRDTASEAEAAELSGTTPLPPAAPSGEALPGARSEPAAYPSAADQSGTAERAGQNLSRQWHDIQAGFVDDPGLAVELAAQATAAALSALAADLQERQSALSQSAGGDTERMRAALQGYRNFYQDIEAAGRQLPQRSSAP